MSDVRKYAVAGVGRLHIRSATDEPMYADGPDGEPDKSRPMIIVLNGPGSKQHAKAKAAQQNRVMDRMKKGKTDQTDEEITREQAEFLAQCTSSFENIDHGDGKLTGTELYKAVYGDLTLGFICEQANKHLGDWANFLKRSTPA